MRALAILALLLCAPSRAAAGGTDAPATPLRLDIGAAMLVEAWDPNGATEALVGVVAGADHPVWRAVGLRAELLALRVRQEERDAWLGGFTIGTRTRWGPPSRQRVLDVAVGLSNATVPVPPSGTRFNYLAVIGIGVERQVRAARVGVTGRWLHASNNGREGRHRNPDIQSLGAVISVGWNH